MNPSLDYLDQIKLDPNNMNLIEGIMDQNRCKSIIKNIKRPKWCIFLQDIGPKHTAELTIEFF